MATFSEFIDSLDPDSKMRGDEFERFVKWFLKNDPEWSKQIDKVWLWNEYPDRWGPDCGIDLVFQHTDGDTWAVQAKCYSPKYSIKKADMDTFLSESNRPQIDKRLLIASTDLIGDNAKRVCDGQEKETVHYLYSDFDAAMVDYPKSISELNRAKRKPRPEPREHQLAAIEAVKKGFKKNDRGQLIMACGTGKTYTTLWIKEKLGANSTLVLVPSLNLLSQTFREWTFAEKGNSKVLCVCSDETVGKKSGEDEIVQSVHDLSFGVTSDTKKIADFLQEEGKKIVFSTYQSSPLIAEAQGKRNVPEFDLVIADEAHRCTGKVDSAFSAVLDAKKIKAKKRLFTTATPRTYSANVKKKAEERGAEVTGMDDHEVFGEVFHTLSFGEAIERDLLTDYQVVIIGVDEPMIASWIKRRELLQTESGESVDAKSLASQIGLIKAIKDYDLRRMISFHSRVKGAESFASDVANAATLVAPRHRPKGSLWAEHVSGAMPVHKRRLRLEQLKDSSQGDRSLLSNARCLSEGVDVPALDGIAFIDPRKSQVDIVQAVGRAIRLSGDKKVGTIVLPVFIEEGDDAESSIENSDFKPVWDVLNALKSHDERLSLELDQLRTDMGRRRSGNGKAGDIARVVIDLPLTVDAKFSESLKTLLVERSSESWNFWYGLLEEYVEEFEHARPALDYETADGTKLGQWVMVQRSKNELLSGDRASKLEAIDGWVWDINEFLWDEGFENLQKYAQEFGNARPLGYYKTESGHNLGSWVLTQRSKKENLNLENILKLESLDGWVWNTQEHKWDEGLEHLERFVEEIGHARPSMKYAAPDGYKLGIWVNGQRAQKDRLNAARISKLEALEGWTWNAITSRWEEGFASLEEFVEEFGHASPSGDYETPNGYNLSTWVGHQTIIEPRTISDWVDGLGGNAATKRV